VLALHREEFYDVASGDLTLLQEIVRALAKRLRTLVAERPEEARVESEGKEATEAPATSGGDAPAATPGTTLTAAALGRPNPEAETPGITPEPLPPRVKGPKPQ